MTPSPQPSLLALLQDPGAVPDPAPAGGAGQGLLELAWIDQVGLAVVAVFLLLGIWRGLWWQVIRLAGMAAAVVVARQATPRLAPHLEDVFSMPEPVAYGASWFALFVAMLLVASLLGSLGRKALETMQLGLVDRFGGGLAGAVTGLLLHAAVLVFLIGVTSTEWSTQALDGTFSGQLLDRASNRWRILVDAQAAERMVAPWVESMGLPLRPREADVDPGDPGPAEPQDGDAAAGGSLDLPEPGR